MTSRVVVIWLVRREWEELRRILLVLRALPCYGATMAAMKLRGTQFTSARVDFRNDSGLFGIKRRRSIVPVYVIGKTGTGKSTLLETMALQDI